MSSIACGDDCAITGPPVSCSVAHVRAANAEAKSTGKLPAVIVLSGSFNPPHAGHLLCLENARAGLEAQGNFKVVACIMAPALDTRVRKKTRTLIHLAHRVRACELLVAERGKCIGVLSQQAAVRVAQQRDAPCAVMAAGKLVNSLLRGKSFDASFATGLEVPDLDVFQVAGLDLLQKWTKIHGSWAGVEAFEQAQPERRPQKIVMFREGAKVPDEAPPSGWYLVRESAQSSIMSSTLCRQHMAQGRWEELALPGVLGEKVCNMIYELHSCDTLYVPDIEMIIDIFRMVDENGTGCISAQKLASAFKRLGVQDVGASAILSASKRCSALDAGGENVKYEVWLRWLFEQC